MKKAHQGLDTCVTIFQLQKTAKGCYRASITDGEDLSNNLYLVGSLEKAEAELLGKISVINLAASDLVINQKVVILASDFSLLGPGPSPRKMGGIKVLSEQYFRGLRPGKAALTPSRMSRKAW